MSALNEKNAKEMASAVSNKITEIAKQTKREVPNNKSFDAIITNKTDNNTYTLKINNQTYTKIPQDRTLGGLDVGMKVKVNVPNNQMSQAYICAVIDGSNTPIIDKSFLSLTANPNGYNSTDYFVKTIVPRQFTNGVANQKVNLYIIPSGTLFSGSINISLTSYWNWSPAVGELKKHYSVFHGDAYNAYYTIADTNTAQYFALGELHKDDIGWYVVISNRSSAISQYKIMIEINNAVQNWNTIQLFENFIHCGDVYTTNTELYPIAIPYGVVLYDKYSFPSSYSGGLSGFYSGYNFGYDLPLNSAKRGKYVKIYYKLYDTEFYLNGGLENCLIINITDNNICSGSCCHVYRESDYTFYSNNLNMGVFVEVNFTYSKVYPYFIFNNTLQTGTNYYIYRIEMCY